MDSQIHPAAELGLGAFLLLVAGYLGWANHALANGASPESVGLTGTHRVEAIAPYMSLLLVVVSVALLGRGFLRLRGD